MFLMMLVLRQGLGGGMGTKPIIMFCELKLRIDCLCSEWGFTVNCAVLTDFVVTSVIFV